MSKQVATGGGGALPYRPCVGLVLVNKDRRIFAGQRIDNPGPAWQMPQGGIDAGEDVRTAGLRELREETGIAAENVRIVAETTDWIRYDLPPELLGRIWGGKYAGQQQKWLALEFLGADADVRIDLHEPEFSRWAWQEPAFLLDRIVPFKRHVYAQVFEEFADLVG